MKHYLELRPVTFPEYSGININMMPIIIGKSSSIPEYLLPYQEMINHCNLPKGSVAYLTIRESLVLTEETQSRPGVHVEAPSAGNFGGGNWGTGNLNNGSPQDGIYLAINDISCMIWDEYIEKRGKFGEVIPLTKGVLLNANKLYWFTDKTPHCALPVTENTYRQLFRLVAEPVSIWYSKHNTSNPNGIQPTCAISDVNKFEAA